MKFFKSILVMLFLFNSGFALADYNDGYGDGYDNGGRLCKLKVFVSLNKNFRYQSDAANHCRWVHSMFNRGCSIRSLGYNRGFGAFFEREFIFEGEGDSWQSSRRSVFDRYFDWSESFGFGRGFKHQLFFDQCGVTW